MAPLPFITSWHFDAFASFIILFSEEQEFRYRLTRPRRSNCLFLAPVAGIQSYLHPRSRLTEYLGIEYISPIGGNRGPLRNIRAQQIIHDFHLLKDGHYMTYQIPDRLERWPGSSRLWLSLWIVATWVISGLFMMGMYLIHDTTWIGKSLCATLLGWSFFLRLSDLFCLQRGRSKGNKGDRQDAIVILGRRNSCLVLEGSRQQIFEWSGQGLEERTEPGERRALIVAWIARIGTLLFLLFVFATIPNGTTADQVGFVLFNGLGQLNLFLSGRLNTWAFLRSWEFIESKSIEDVGTRTHVYGRLLRQFKEPNTDWAEKVGLLPNTSIWASWRKRINEPGNEEKDAKELYDECVADFANGAQDPNGNLPHVSGTQKSPC